MRPDVAQAVASSVPTERSLARARQHLGDRRRGHVVLRELPCGLDAHGAQIRHQLLAGLLAGVHPVQLEVVERDAPLE
ncbi:hypothetical protein ACNQUF_12200, partial [Corynebacterium diphtheriae]